MHSKWNRYYILTSLILLLSGLLCKSQNITDTLRFEDVINNVLQNNPLIMESREKLNNSVLAVKLARTAYLPTIDINASYSHMAPIPSFDIPEFGHVQLYPDNSLNTSLDAHQLLYDFGRTNRTVSLQERGKELTELTGEQQKQNLVLSSANNFYSLVYLQTAGNILKEHLNTLNQHLDFIEKMKKTGSATDYEILSTRVQVSVAETQLTNLETNFTVQLSLLNTLMGTNFRRVYVVCDTSHLAVQELPDSSFLFAAAHRDEILIVQKKRSIEEMNLSLVKASNNPTLGIFASGGYKNGYLPDIEKLQANYIVGMTLKVPLFEGNRKNLKTQMAYCSLQQDNYELENISRQLHDEISACYVQLKLSQQKIRQSELQLQQAQQAYDQAELNFREGTITNLDLINAGDILSQTKLMLLRTKIDYQVNMLQFKAAMGERLY